MTSETATADVHGASPVSHDDAHHPPDNYYIRVVVILAVLTAIEVALSYIKAIEGLALVIPLLVVMAIKFGCVALYFMHLKWDSKVLTRLFYCGLLLAVGVYVVMLTTFVIFNN